MANITLPYTLANGNTADGGQVQQNFDAIVTQVNGNLDANNLATGAVTLAKLASDVKVIENVYHQELASTTTLTKNVETIVLSQDVTLSTPRYCFFIASIELGINTSSDSIDIWLRYTISGTATTLSDYMGTPGSVSPSPIVLYSYAQLPAGTSTIEFVTYPYSNNETAYTDSTKLTIIQFAF